MREGVRTDCEEEGRAPVCALGRVEDVVEEGDAWVHVCEVSARYQHGSMCGERDMPLGRETYD